MLPRIFMSEPEYTKLGPPKRDPEPVKPCPIDTVSVGNHHPIRGTVVVEPVPKVLPRHQSALVTMHTNAEHIHPLGSTVRWVQGESAMKVVGFREHTDWVLCEWGGNDAYAPIRGWFNSAELRRYATGGVANGDAVYRVGENHSGEGIYGRVRRTDGDMGGVEVFRPQIIESPSRIDWLMGHKAPTAVVDPPSTKLATFDPVDKPATVNVTIVNQINTGATRCSLRDVDSALLAGVMQEIWFGTDPSRT